MKIIAIYTFDLSLMILEIIELQDPSGDPFLAGSLVASGTINRDPCMLE